MRSDCELQSRPARRVCLVLVKHWKTPTFAMARPALGVEAAWGRAETSIVDYCPPTQRLVLGAEGCRSFWGPDLHLTELAQHLEVRQRVACIEGCRQLASNRFHTGSCRRIEVTFRAECRAAVGFVISAPLAIVVSVVMVSCCMDWQCYAGVALEQAQIVVGCRVKEIDLTDVPGESFHKETARMVRAQNCPSSRLELGVDAQAFVASVRKISRRSATGRSSARNYAA